MAASQLSLAQSFLSSFNLSLPTTNNCRLDSSNESLRASLMCLTPTPVQLAIVFPFALKSSKNSDTGATPLTIKKSPARVHAT
jgi:hypothetical protein